MVFSDFSNVKTVEVVAALIRKNGRFLICRRPASKARALLWEYVGGKVEPGETHEDALIRECREELGISLTVGKIFTEVDHTYPDIKIHLTLFNAFTDDEPRLLEHADLKWILPSEIPLFDFCPADKDINEKIMKEFDS